MSPPPITQNTLFYGDNLKIMREHIPDASVDLVYLDPPFNSNRNYNVLFKDERGTDSEAQITAFEDTWHWNGSAQATYDDLLLNSSNVRVGEMIEALHRFIGNNQMMAYLVMMAARLVELHRVLKPTGSLYLHCDPTASHYLKIVLDTIFDPRNFRNEIVWERTSSHNDAKRKYADVADVIFFYSKTDKYLFNVQYTPYDESYLQAFYRHVDEHGRRYRLSDLRSPNPRPNLTYDYKGYKPHPNGWAVSREKMAQLDKDGRLYFPKSPDGRIQYKRFLDEMSGNPVGSIWSDIQPIQAQAAERLGYPTQKPLALLERIIQASSNPGDVVLDPFCGCGTAIAAAEKLGRKWIGIDITFLSIALQKSRMKAMFGDIPYRVIGEPVDVHDARQLADSLPDGRYQFQWWALSLVGARPLGGQEGSKTGKKGADKGVDGIITFIDDASGKAKRVIVQVKSGNVKAGDIQQLIGTVEQEKAAMGVFITLEEPTGPMKAEAIKAGSYQSPDFYGGAGKKYQRIQILTIEQLLRGEEIKMPPPGLAYKQAQKVEQSAQTTMDLG